MGVFATSVRTAAALLLLASSVAGLAACGSSGDSATTETTPKPEAADFSISTGATGDHFVIPIRIRSGLTTIRLRNKTDRTASLEMVKVLGEHSESEVSAAYRDATRGKAIPEWLRAAGGVGVTGAGAEQSVSQVLQPGSYFAFDTESDNLDYATFEVTGPSSFATLPLQNATIDASEYMFEVNGLKAGENTVKFSDTGDEPHHLIAAPIEAGATIEDVERAIRRDSGRPPLDLDETTSTAVLDSGESQIINLDLRSGSYAFLCFVSDREGGPPHALKGMVREVTVK